MDSSVQYICTPCCQLSIFMLVLKVCGLGGSRSVERPSIVIIVPACSHSFVYCPLVNKWRVVGENSSLCAVISSLIFPAEDGRLC